MGAMSCHGKGNKNKKKGQFILDDKPLGKGGFVKVYRGRSKLNPNLGVAVKRFNKMQVTDAEGQAIKEETDRLGELDHPNIVKYVEWYENKKNLCIASEFIESDSLGLVIIRGRKDFTEYEASVIMKQLLNAVQYIHSKGIIHRNIKPENIMIDEGLNVTLVDFGLSRLTAKGGNINYSTEESQFTAPEFFKGEGNEKNDIWALGNLAYYLLSGKMPFGGDNIMSTFK